MNSPGSRHHNCETGSPIIHHVCVNGKISNTGTQYTCITSYHSKIYMDTFEQ